jgi:hypothetical protein
MSREQTRSPQILRTTRRAPRNIFAAAPFVSRDSRSARPLLYVRPTKYHRYNFIGTHSSAHRRPPKLFIFNRLQKSAHLIENKHPQAYCIQSIAHSFSLFSWKSFTHNQFPKTYPGVWGVRAELPPPAVAAPALQPRASNAWG